MKKVFLLALVALFASCSSDDDNDVDFKKSCKCVLEFPDGSRTAIDLTDCSYNGKVIHPVIGPRYICE